MNKYVTFPLLYAVDMFSPSASMFALIFSGRLAPGKSKISRCLRNGCSSATLLGKTKYNSAVSALKNDFLTDNLSPVGRTTSESPMYSTGTLSGAQYISFNLATSKIVPCFLNTDLNGIYTNVERFSLRYSAIRSLNILVMSGFLSQNKLSKSII